MNNLRESNMRTIDMKFRDLCDEIDYWKSEARHWENECKQDSALNKPPMVMQNKN